MDLPIRKITRKELEELCVDEIVVDDSDLTDDEGIEDDAGRSEAVRGDVA